MKSIFLKTGYDVKISIFFLKFLFVFPFENYWEFLTLNPQVPTRFTSLPENKLLKKIKALFFLTKGW